MTYLDPAQAAHLLDDASTPPEALARIAHQYPGLRARVMVHPNLYPELATWISQQGHDAQPADQPPVAQPAAHQSPSGGTGTQPASSPTSRRRAGVWWASGIVAVALVALLVALVAWPGYLRSGSDSLSQRLELLPAPTGDTFYVVLTDLDHAGELIGHERPETAGEDLQEWLIAVAGLNSETFPAENPVSVYLPRYLYDYGTLLSRAVETSTNAEAALGYAPANASGIAEIADFPPGPRVTVLDLEHSEDDIDAALGTADDGVWAWGGQEGAINMADTTVNPPLGQSLRIGADGDHVYVGNGAEIVRSALDSSTERLSDDEAVAGIVSILDDHDAYSAMIQRHDFGQDWAYVSASVALQPFTTVGQGVSVQDGLATATVVYHHTSQDAARANAETLEEHLSSDLWLTQGPADLVTLESIEADGEFVVAVYTVEQGEINGAEVPPGMSHLSILDSLGYVG